MIEFPEKAKIVEPYTQESFNFFNKIYGTNLRVFREVGNQKFTTAKRQKYANGTTLLVIDLNKSNEISEETLKLFLDNKALKQIEIAKTFCNRYKSQATTNVEEDSEVLALPAELRDKINQARDQINQAQLERQEFARRTAEQNLAIASIVEDDCYTSVEQTGQNEFIPQQQQLEHINNVLQCNFGESSNHPAAAASTNKRPVFNQGKPLHFSLIREEEEEEEEDEESSSSSESSLEDTDCRIVTRNTSEIGEPIREQTDDVRRMRDTSAMTSQADPRPGTSKDNFIEFQQYFKKVVHTLVEKRGTGKNVKQQDFKDNQFNIYEFHFHFT